MATFETTLCHRDGVSVFHAGDVAAEQSCTFFDLALGELLLHAQLTQPVADDYWQNLQSQ